MRRHKPNSVEKYIKIRLKMLYDERAKNDDDVAHMVLDKSIYRTARDTGMIERKAPLLAEQLDDHSGSQPNKLEEHSQKFRTTKASLAATLDNDWLSYLHYTCIDPAASDHMIPVYG